MASETSAVVTQETLFLEFDELFRAHYKLIYRTAFGIIGSVEDAEDVLQTIFMRLLGREFPPDLKRNPRAYLYRAAVNASLNKIRSRWRHVQVVDINAIPSVASKSGSQGDDETKKRLLHAISQLNTRAVEILILRYVHDYSDAEIAKMLGTSRSAIAVNLFRSRAKIKRLMRGTRENL